MYVCLYICLFVCMSVGIYVCKSVCILHVWAKNLQVLLKRNAQKHVWIDVE
jgi:hypothetical protein